MQEMTTIVDEIGKDQWSQARNEKPAFVSTQRPEVFKMCNSVNLPQLLP